jgi:hypothetical protein
MGLDQYAFARKGEENIEISYWRKHANLQGWMEALFAKRGGEGQFNCIDLRLFEEDLTNLEREHDNLETATGFFWGVSQLEDIEATKEFIAQAKELIAQGYEIVYTSWW